MKAEVSAFKISLGLLVQVYVGSALPRVKRAVWQPYIILVLDVDEREQVETSFVVEE